MTTPSVPWQHLVHEIMLTRYPIAVANLLALVTTA